MNRGTRGAARGRAGASSASRQTGEGSGTAAAGNTRGTSTGTSSPAPAPSVRARASAARATRAAGSSTGRFRPKNVRRDEAERQALVREEERKDSIRAAAEERGKRGRGRFRSKRSRGDAMGARTSTSRATITGGTEGSFRSGGGSGFGAGGGGGGGGMRSGGSRAKSEGGFRQANEYRETRINADRLHNPDMDEADSEDEAMMEALSSRSHVLPMGIYRKEHKDTGVVVATTAELEAAEQAGDEESLWVDGDTGGTGSPGDQPLPEQPAEEGVWDTGGKKPVVVKKEPEDESTMMDVDPKIEEAPEKKEEEKKPRVEIKVKKAPPQEPEDRRIQTDLNMLANELGSITVSAEDGGTRTEGPSDKDGRLYLFQFPPLLPPLKASDLPQSQSNVKAEPEDAGGVSNVPPAPKDPATSVDLTGDDDGADTPKDTAVEDKEPFKSSMLSEGGMIGQLNVRKSGKVELSWGGRILELSPATGMNFLTTAIMMETNDEKPAPNVIGGESIGMGKIMGRFVVSPVWSEEEDWEVAPGELVIDQPEG